MSASLVKTAARRAAVNGVHRVQVRDEKREIPQSTRPIFGPFEPKVSTSQLLLSDRRSAHMYLHVDVSHSRTSSAPHWPETAFEGVSNTTAVVGLPTDAQTPTHTRSLRHSFFRAIGTTREALIAAHSAHRPFFLFAPLFFLCAYPSFPQRNFAPGSTRNDDRQLDRPTTSPVLSLHFPSQSRSLAG